PLQGVTPAGTPGSVAVMDPMELELLSIASQSLQPIARRHSGLAPSTSNLTLGAMPFDQKELGRHKQQLHRRHSVSEFLQQQQQQQQWQRQLPQQQQQQLHQQVQQQWSAQHLNQQIPHLSMSISG
ncbi:hypothetical protein Agub_g7095, partial [Astrephomene gubernaculifera]